VVGSVTVGSAVEGTLVSAGASVGFPSQLVIAIRRIPQIARIVKNDILRNRFMQVFYRTFQFFEVVFKFQVDTFNKHKAALRLILEKGLVILYDYTD
jgi:hypothetical protein